MDELNDNEFDLLDELYFVQHFSILQENLDLSEAQIIATILSLIKKGLIKALSDHDTEFNDVLKLPEVDVPWQNLYFLATKKGLMIHNGF